MNRMPLRFLPLCAVLIAAGCSMLSGSSDTDSRAARHMTLADSLERGSFLREATLEYTIVADQYPDVPFYPTAVRKAAILSVNPLNPAANDSVAMHWIDVYLKLPVAAREKESASALAAQLSRISDLREDIVRQSRVADSLGTVVRRQSALLGSQSRRIQELEAGLKQVNDELKRLKEIDLQHSKNRIRK